MVNEIKTNKRSTIIASCSKEGSFLNSLKEFFQVIWRNKMARVGFIILIFFLILSIFGPMII